MFYIQCLDEDLKNDCKNNELSLLIKYIMKQIRSIELLAHNEQLEENLLINRVRN